MHQLLDSAVHFLAPYFELQSSLVLPYCTIFLVGLLCGWVGMKRFFSSCKATITSTLLSEETKMVLVVRKDLKMGAGKVAAQCAHAAVASVERLTEMSSQSTSVSPATDLTGMWTQWFTAWRHTGYAKVVLQCPDEEEMMAVATRAKGCQLPYYIIRDAGRTQIAAGSKTVIAVGPGPKSLVDTVTGNLKLY